MSGTQTHTHTKQGTERGKRFYFSLYPLFCCFFKSTVHIYFFVIFKTSSNWREGEVINKDFIGNRKKNK